MVYALNRGSVRFDNAYVLRVCRVCKKNVLYCLQIFVACGLLTLTCSKGFHFTKYRRALMRVGKYKVK